MGWSWDAVRVVRSNQSSRGGVRSLIYRETYRTGIDSKTACIGHSNNGPLEYCYSPFPISQHFPPSILFPRFIFSLFRPFLDSLHITVPSLFYFEINHLSFKNFLSCFKSTIHCSTFTNKTIISSFSAIIFPYWGSPIISSLIHPYNLHAWTEIHSI